MIGLKRVRVIVTLSYKHVRTWFAGSAVDVKQLRIPAVVRQLVFDKFKDGSGNKDVFTFLNKRATAGLNGDAIQGAYENRRKTLTPADIKSLHSQWVRSAQIHSNDQVALNRMIEVSRLDRVPVTPPFLAFPCAPSPTATRLPLLTFRCALLRRPMFLSACLTLDRRMASET